MPRFPLLRFQIRYLPCAHVAIVLIKRKSSRRWLLLLGSFLCFSFLSLISIDDPNALIPPHTSHRKVLFDIRGEVEKTHPDGKLHAQKGKGPSARRALKSPLRGAEPLGPKITRSKEKGAVGAPRAKITSEGRGITLSYKLRAQKRKGMSARRSLLSPLRGAGSIGPKNYTLKRERGRRRAARSYML